MHYEYLTLNVGGSKPQRKKLEGRWHVVAPVAMIAEGVWVGNRGKILYTERELQRCVPTCDHKPAILGHPRPGVSGCDPEVINRRKVGVVLNTAQKKKLRSECWVDEDRCAELDIRVLNAVRQGDPIECSTGLVIRSFKKQKGVFNKEEYDFIARNICMDHLAVVTDGVGAYSVKDGGGINVLNEAMKQVPEAILAALVRGADDRLLRVGANFVNNALSFNSISTQVCEMLGTKFGEPGKYWTGNLYEVYDGYVIFTKGDGTSDLHLIDYTIKGDSVSLTGDAKPVRRVVEYRADNGAYIEDSTGQLALNLEDSEMAKFDKKAHVTALIEAGLYEETDREELEKTPDSVLQKIKADKVSNQTPPAKKKTKPAEDVEDTDDDVDDTPEPIQKKKVKVVANESPKPPTLKELLAQADPRDREAYEEAQESLDRERTELVGVIVANKGNQFTEDWLKLRSIKELRGFASLARVNNSRGSDDDDDEGDEDGEPPMFIGAGGVRSRTAVQNKAKDLPLLLPPGQKEQKEEKEVA